MKDRQTIDPNLIFQPKYIAQKCPVCNGWGTVSYKQIVCHACTGKGYIFVPFEKNYEKTSR